jgi:hypothetical protein
MANLVMISILFMNEFVTYVLPTTIYRVYVRGLETS